MRSSNTRHSARTQDRKAAFKARQERIIETQSRRGLTACERLVIAIIGQHENLKTGQCDPGVETIARESGLHERAVYRAIAGAERKGALVITRTGHGGRNGRNSYRLGGGNPDKMSGLNPDKETLTKRSKNPEGADARGAPPEPFEERPESHSEPEPGGTPPTNGQAHDARDDGGLHAAWRALVELWLVRPWPMTPRELAIARQIFVTAIANGTTVDAILAGAGAWVGAVSDPWFLKALPQWLAARCWEYPPPTKPKRQTGPRRGYQRREGTDLASMMYQLGRTM